MSYVYTSGEFGIFPAKILYGLEPLKQVLVSWLIYHTNNQTGVAFPSLDTLGKETGIRSRTALIKHLKELEEMGMIRKVRRWKEAGGATSNEYEVFIRRMGDSPSEEQGVVHNVDSNYKKKNQKKDNQPDELFENSWFMYGCKGNKQTAKRYWDKLSDSDKNCIAERIPIYVLSRPDKKYRKDFQGWINPANRMWEDAIAIEDNKLELSPLVKGFLR